MAQALAIGGLAWPGRARWRLPRAVSAAALATAAAGIALGAAGVLAQGRQLTPRVEPPPSAALLTHGPYALSRHPVYGGLLAAGAGWAVARRRPEPLAAWAVLAVVLHVKTVLEERALRERFGDAWATYADRTPRLVGLRVGRGIASPAHLRAAT